MHIRDYSAPTIRCPNMRKENSNANLHACLCEADKLLDFIHQKWNQNDFKWWKKKKRKKHQDSNPCARPGTACQFKNRCSGHGPNSICVSGKRKYNERFIVSAKYHIRPDLNVWLIANKFDMRITKSLGAELSIIYTQRGEARSWLIPTDLIKARLSRFNALIICDWILCGINELKKKNPTGNIM